MKLRSKINYRLWERGWCGHVRPVEPLRDSTTNPRVVRVEAYHPILLNWWFNWGNHREGWKIVNDRRAGWRQYTFMTLELPPRKIGE